MARRYLVIPLALIVVGLSLVGTGAIRLASAVTPIRVAVYYPWFPETWSAGTRYTPALGHYDSSNPTILASHISAMQWGGIQAGIASWWGQGSPTDGRVQTLLNAAHGKGFSWTLYYEPEGYGNPTSAQIDADLVYLEAKYTNDPSWLKVAGRPVLFVYGDGSDGCAMADRWSAASHRGDFYLVLKVFGGYLQCAHQPDSWHQYGPAVREDRQGSYSFSISPGFYKASEASPRLVRDPVAWNTNVCDMIASGAQWQLVQTLNEWGEGTSVEPASEWQSASGYGTYLDTLRSPQCSTASTPTPSTQPTPSPSSSSTPSPTPLSPPPSPSSTATPTLVASPTVTGTPSSSATATLGATPTPTPSPSGPLRHVVVVWLENHEASSVTASSMPYLTGLGNTYGLATNYDAVSHPSLPNYLAFWSGSTQGVSDDGTYNFNRPSLSSQLSAAGISWRTYAQNYPSGGACSTGSSYSGGTDGWGVAGTYARKHNPAISFTSVSGNPASCANIKPLAAFDPSVNLAFVVPNLCNDAHDCSLGTADNFLKAFLPTVFASASYQNGSTLVIETFDEGTSGTGGGGHVYMALQRAGMAHIVSNALHNHYGLTRTVEDVLGVPCLNSACSAVPLSEFTH